MDTVPVNWSDETQRLREGLDLRGADLCCVDLSNLPLARLRGGLSEEEWRKAEENPSRYEAAAYMEKTVLSSAHLEGAILNRIFLERATLSEAHLRKSRPHFGPFATCQAPKRILRRC